MDLFEETDRLVSEEWEIHGQTLRPSRAYTIRPCSFCCDYNLIDTTFRFAFPAHFGVKDAYIHESRLLWAGGPFAVLTKSAFREIRGRKVSLSDEDDPVTFSFLRDFLYGKEINLQGIAYCQLLRIIRSSHRWKLLKLCRALCRFIYARAVIKNASDVLSSADLLYFPDIPQCFTGYFWDNIAYYFNELHHEVDDVDEEQEESYANRHAVNSRTHHGVKNVSHLTVAQESTHIATKLFPNCPGIFELPMRKGEAARLIHGIKPVLTSKLRDLFLEVILVILEARIEDDVELLELIALLISGWTGNGALLNRSIVDKVSCRAVRLLSVSLLSPSRICFMEKHEISSSWNSKVVDDPRRSLKYCTYGMADYFSHDGECIRFRFNTAQTEDSSVTVSLSIDIGRKFPLKDSSMEILLTISDGCCVCGGVASRSRALKDLLLNEAIYIETLRNAERERCREISQDVMSTYRESHKEGGNCAVTFSFRARFFPRSTKQ